MNKQITRLAVAAIVLIASLIIATTYWQTWATAGLADRQDNALIRVAQFTIDRGKIYAADGKFLLATNVARHISGQTLFFRRYPSGDLAPHVVGYSTQSRSRAGLERSESEPIAAQVVRDVHDRDLLLLSGLRMVVEHGPGAGDADKLAETTHVPRVLWSGLWLVGTTVALVLGGSLLV